MTSPLSISTALIARLTAAIPGVPDLAVSVKRGGADTQVPLPVEAYPSKVSQPEIDRLADLGAVLVRYMGIKRQPIRRARGYVVEDARMYFEAIVLSHSLLPASQATGVYDTLDLAARHLRFFAPDGAVGMCELGEEQLLSEFGDQVWQYGLLVAVPVQAWQAVAGPLGLSAHVREQLIDAVLPLLDLDDVAVGRGSQLALIYDQMPEMVVSLGDESISPDDDSLGATMRLSTLTVKIGTIGDHSPEASAIMSDVESALFVDGVVGGRIFGGLARALAIGPVSSKYVTGGVFDYTETVATYEVAYKCKDGHAETAS